MGKDGGFLTAKAIGKRIKAKGLQKLRWFCQPCGKQCRDENGFQNHCRSESHMRQMQLFSSNAGKQMDKWSREFEAGFMDILSRRHGTQRIDANRVYNEYIQDKLHTHMNSTQWTSLAGFVQYLGRQGKVVCEETERGWDIQWINRDPVAAERQRAHEAKRRHDMGDDERQRRFIAQQAAAAAAAGASASAAAADDAPAEFKRDDPEERVSLSLAPAAGAGAGAAAAARPGKAKRKRATLEFAAEPAAPADAGATAAAAAAAASETERIIAEERRRREREAERQRQQRPRRDDWVTPGVMVKVLSKRVGGGEYYKLKGTIVEVRDTYVATVRMRDSGDELRVDQADLETVVAAPGGRVRVVLGPRRGEEGVLERIDEKRFCATLRLDRSGVVEGVPYEDFSRVGGGGGGRGSGGSSGSSGRR